MQSNGHLSRQIKEQLIGMAKGDPDIFAEFFELQIENQVDSGLDAQTYNLVRLAALASMDAAPASWLMNLAIGDAEDIAFEQVLSMFVAIAPLIGTARIVAATGNILRAIGLADALEDVSGQPATAHSSA